MALTMALFVLIFIYLFVVQPNYSSSFNALLNYHLQIPLCKSKSLAVNKLITVKPYVFKKIAVHMLESIP